MAFPTGNPNTSAVGIEKGYPREVRLNEQFEYVIVVTNLTGNELESVMVTDQPNGSMQLTESDPRGRVGANGVPMWELGNLGPGESRTIRVKARATQEGTVGTCATVTYNSALCATVPVVAPKLALTKAGPAEVMKCEPITYTFEVKNTGTGTLNNVMVKDDLPQGLTGPNGARTLSFDAGSLAAGQAKKFTSTVNASRTGRFENTATATGGNLSVNSNAVATMVRQPVLTISKTCSARAFIGRPINYEITVTNTGDGAANGTTISDSIPAGLTFMSASDGGRVQNGQIVWNVGSLAPRASKTVSAQLSAGQAGTYRNTASANADCADAVTDGCETVVTGIPAILLEVVDDPDPIRIGTETTYTITVTNQGSAPDNNIRIVCNLEANQEHVSSGGATNASVSGRTITFAPVPTLAPKAVATFRVVVRATAEGDTRFKVTMNSDNLKRPVEETEATNQYE
ncbi:MAG: DUF11 domain-containing protein [Phycisphaerales bacterium]|nr:DUF11 domain-containing protein [Phycisphaerales bacterium]